MGIRYRKNINCLSTEELHDLREAFAEMYTLPATSDDSYERLAGLHGGPAPSYCVHGYPGFLTWHRAYLLAFEEALRKINCDVTLPFWDWSSKATVGLPAAVSSPTYENRSGDTVSNPLYSAPIPASVSADGTTSRSGTVDSRDFSAYATSVASAMTNTDFDDFQVDLNGPHGGVHVAVGGHMASVWTAGFDPIFWMHHANVDRIWANWQIANPAALPADENALELDPFSHTIGTSLKTGEEMFSTVALGYRYSNWCIYVLPWPLRFPLDIWKVVPFKTLSRIKLVFTCDRMPMHSAEARVFLNEKDANHETPLSRETFAGSVGFFGGMGPAGDGMRMGKRGRFDQSVDLTNALKRSPANSPAELQVAATSPTGESVDFGALGITGVKLLVEH